MKLLRFEEFITESRGISNVIKNYTSAIFDNFINGGTSLSGDLSDPDLFLVNFNIEFILSDKYHGLNNTTHAYVSDSKLFNIQILIEYIENYDSTKIKELITHELTHVKEFFEYFKKIEELEIKFSKNNSNLPFIKVFPTWTTISMLRQDIVKHNTDNYRSNFFNKFLYFIYLSLDTELNARVSQLYSHLLDLNTTNINTIRNGVNKHENIQHISMLEQFDTNIFTNELISEIGEDNCINLTAKFCANINESNIKSRVVLLNNLPDNITDMDGVKQFYNTWDRLFKTKLVKHKEKIESIIKEVIKDVSKNNEILEKFGIDKLKERREIGKNWIITDGQYTKLY